MTRRVLLKAAGILAVPQKSLDILKTPPPKPDFRIAYGSSPSQFGELRVPSGNGPHPVVVYCHGGFWKALYDLKHAGHPCAALTEAGVATWNLEFRRIGEPGGGWRGTFDDVKLGAAHLRQLAPKYNLDLRRVVIAGHSAGGHLALWLAAQNTIEARAVVSLSGVVDLKRAYELKLSKGIVETFLGGSPKQAPARYAAADPIELLPIRTPQWLLHGTNDEDVPFEISERFSQRSHNAYLIPLQNAGHFELVDPRTQQWQVVRKTILERLA